ncbi:Uncharacterized protein SCF082_LOCUS45739 [Durusdinium trenchii]|uniref:CUE domain-containing protein n=1 Tax=Durusdinium trenchii TaxID=1381693 RepID=A0ABP0REF5_9DINO
MQAACELLQDEELVEGFADLCEILASDVGLSAYEVVMRVLELPAKYVELAAEMDPDDFPDLLCIALESPDEDDERKTASQRSYPEPGSPASSVDAFGGIEDVDDEERDEQHSDGLSSSSSQEEHEMPAVLDGEVRVDLKEEMGRGSSKINVLTPGEGKGAEKGSGDRSSMMLIGITKAVAALQGRRGSIKERRQSIARGSGTIMARRASRAELQQLRRASHLKLEGSNDNLDGSGGVNSMTRMRSFRRMSSHLNAAEGEGGEVTKVRSTRTAFRGRWAWRSRIQRCRPCGRLLKNMSFIPSCSSRRRAVRCEGAPSLTRPRMRVSVSTKSCRGMPHSFPCLQVYPVKSAWMRRLASSRDAL